MKVSGIRISFWRLILILSLPLIFFTPTLFVHQNLMYTNSPKPGHFNYYYNTNISYDNRTFYIVNDELQNENNLIIDIGYKVYNIVSFGWHDICFHNIKTTAYRCNKEENSVNVPAYFAFFSKDGEIEKEISLYSGEEYCELHNTKNGIRVSLGYRIECLSIPEMINYFEKNPHNCPNSEDNLGFNCSINSEIYIKPNIWLELLKSFLLLLVWAGIIFMNVEIWKFLQKKS